jgi:hypothetical protein
MSPVAKVCGTMVCIWISTLMEPSVGHSHGGLLSANILAIGRAAHGLQYQIIDKRCGALTPQLSPYSTGADVTSMLSGTRIKRRFWIEHVVLNNA